MTTMSMLQDIYDQFRTGFWADRDPAVCLCHGTGYALSDVDTWHACPVHFVPGQSHPEDAPYEDDDTNEGLTDVALMATVTPAVLTVADEDDIPF